MTGIVASCVTTTTTERKGPTEYPGVETFDNIPDTVRVGGGLPDAGEHDTVEGEDLTLLICPCPGLALGPLLQQEILLRTKKNGVFLSTWHAV